MKGKGTLKSTIQFLKMIQKEQKSIVFLLVAGSFFTSVAPFVSLVFSTEVLNLVYEGKQRACVPYVVGMLISNLLLGLVAKGCNQMLEVSKKASYLMVERKTAYRAFTMNYEEYEQPETLDAIRRVKQGEQVGGGVGSQIGNLNVLLGQVWTIIFSFFFVVQLFQRVNYTKGDFFSSYVAVTLFVFLYCGIVAFTFCFAQRANVKCNKMRMDNEHNNSIANYVLSLTAEYRYGKDIRLFDMGKLILHCYDYYYDKYASMYLTWGKMNGALGGVMIFISQIPAFLSYLFVIAQARNGVILVGEILLYAGAIIRLTQAVEQTIVSYNSFAYKMDYLKMYQMFIEQPDKNEGVECIDKSVGNWEFTFENVSFHYPGSRQNVLEDIHLTIRQGERIAIVGQNGAGKTTIVKLLCQFYQPTSGKILLNGRDIRTYQKEEYRKLFSAVFQDFRLFSFSLGENVAGQEQIEEEKVWQVLEQAGMKEMVEGLPEKLNTQLYQQNGEGVEISGGQAQKIAIARALYQQRPVVILDEPASALDPYSEAEIYEKFHQVVNQKTAIYISHRMSSCKFCERILVLDKGHIVQQGSHETLLKEDGLYRKLYQTQAHYYV